MVYFIIGGSCLIAFIIWINVKDAKRRSKLTEGERREEDEQREREKPIW